ncbi:hypothetical protein BOQ54_19210 (plasmid) [Chelatococcus daeguensis]|uniref:Uncharacterized protein n=1 Tax=Chelatococcus daeguensis TaxID=444444 RepID=A0AAC9P0H3_9HYPH|nr:hypothetical protein BOQ54_19210 [Chelatococcus daeguensis]
MTIDDPSATAPSAVMAGLVPAIHASGVVRNRRAWMPARGAGMTVKVAFRRHAGALPRQGNRETRSTERTGRNR